MCTINMTFDIPESKAIDIEALKQNVQAYVSLLVSFPSVLKKDCDTTKTNTEKMLERFAGCWHGEETQEQIISCIREGRTVREPLSM